MVLLMPIVLLLASSKCIATNMTGFIVGGKYSSIKDFPYQVFLEIDCSGNFACGASILNQWILLTAAHCVYQCRNWHIVTAYVGDVRQMSGISRRLDGIRAHKGFTYETGDNDIAVAKLKTELVFGKNVRRVALLENPPYDGPAYVAGWGLIDQKTAEGSIYLQHTSQEVWDSRTCNKVLYAIPVSCFCAEHRLKNSHPSKGDSGGALVVRGVIQIGVVSHEDLSRPTLRIYTNVTHFYDWIQTNANVIYNKKCGKKLN